MNSDRLTNLLSAVSIIVSLLMGGANRLIDGTKSATLLRENTWKMTDRLGAPVQQLRGHVGCGIGRTMGNENRLIIFTRYPEPGTCKTRLIPELGPDGAASLQRVMTERIVQRCRIAAAAIGGRIEVHYAGGTKEQMVQWLGPLTCVRQADGDLGWRMRFAFGQAFRQGAPGAVLVGSDVPGLSVSILEQAIAALHGDQVVLGSTLDGGYYLVGLRAEYADHGLPLLFENIPWSTGTVFTETRRRLDAAGVPLLLLPQLQDVDRPEDLQLARELGVW